MAVEELERRYRRAKDGIERSHWQMLWLLAQGMPAKDVAKIAGYTVQWVRMLAQRYNQNGPTAAADRRHSNPGKRQLLSNEQQDVLAHLLDGPSPDGGQWSGPKVAEWIGQQIGRTVRPQLGWDYLCRLHRRPLVPRPSHAQADPVQQEAFKKTSQTPFA